MTEIRGNRFGLDQAPQEILGLLEEIAAGYGLASAQERRYYFADWKTLRRIDWRSLAAIKQRLGALRRSLQGNTYLSRCGAEYLQLKNHYLGFYPAQGVVIKIFLDRDAFSRHLQGAERFNQGGNQLLKAPRILSQGLAPHPHTRESYISGKNFQLLPLDLKADLVAELADFHFRQPSAGEEVVAGEDQERLVDSLERLGLDPIQLDRIRAFLKPSSWGVVEGEIHGDLNRGNLIQGEDAVYLTDWEYFSRGPVAGDLVKLYSQAGAELRRILLDVYHAKGEGAALEGAASGFLSSLLLYTLKSLLSLDRESREQLSLVFKDQAEVNHKVAAYEQILLGSIQSLLAAAEKG